MWLEVLQGGDSVTKTKVHMHTPSPTTNPNNISPRSLKIASPAEAAWWRRPQTSPVRLLPKQAWITIPHGELECIVFQLNLAYRKSTLSPLPKPTRTHNHPRTAFHVHAQNEMEILLWSLRCLGNNQHPHSNLSHIVLRLSTPSKCSYREISGTRCILVGVIVLKPH
jgi:hypothetical protein